MTCNIARRLIPLHAGGDLPAFVDAWVGGHAARCKACAAELRSIQGARRQLGMLGSADERQATPASLGDNFWLEIRRDLRSEGLVRAKNEPAPAHGARHRRREAVRGLATRALAAAAAAVMAAVIFFPYEGANQPPARPGEVAKAIPGVPTKPVELLLPSPLLGATGWIERTESFVAPDARFGLERWSNEEDSGRNPEVELTSF